MQLLIIKAYDKYKCRKSHKKEVCLLDIWWSAVAFWWKRRTIEVEKGHNAYQKNKQHQYHIEMFKQPFVYSKHFFTPLSKSSLIDQNSQLLLNRLVQSATEILIQNSPGDWPGSRTAM